MYLHTSSFPEEGIILKKIHLKIHSNQVYIEIKNSTKHAEEIIVFLDDIQKFLEDWKEVVASDGTWP